MLLSPASFVGMFVGVSSGSSRRRAPPLMLLAPKRLKFTNYIKESPELRRSRSRPRASKTMHTVRSSLPHTGRHAGRNTAHRLPRPLRRMNRLLLFVRVLIDSLHCFLVFLFFFWRLSSSAFSARRSSQLRAWWRFTCVPYNSVK